MTSEANKILLIVESPSKCKSFEKYIPNSNCQASFGHVYDLPPDKLAIDPNDNFKANYEIIKDKKKTVVNLLFHAAKCKDIIICSDADREGEAIAWSLAQVLKLNNPKRLIFNEITQAGLSKAMENITTINMDMFHSQQCRRFLDRLMGYKISPILQTYLQGSLSAGRVQSIATMIIIDRENEVLDSIKNVIDKPFYKSTADFKFNDIIISGTLTKDKDYYKVENKDQAIEILNKLNKTNICKVIDTTINETKRNPPPPHITSSILQEASTKFGFNSKKTMQVCQQLFEKGLITYHRSDSIVISDTAISSIKKYINTNYGEKYYQFRNYKEKVDNNAQAAHECVRPTDINKEQIDDIEGVNNDMIRVYSMIYKRTVASLMAPAIIDIQKINIDIITGQRQDSNNSILPKDTFYQSIYEHIKFDGYLVVYNDKDNNSDEEKPISGKIDIKINTVIDFVEMNMDETFNSPLMRYNESALIKLFKKENIARPATYSSIISKIIDREYVKIQNIEGIPKDVLNMSVSAKKYGTIKEKIKNIKIGNEKLKFVPTELGIKVNAFLMEHFKPIMDIKFTSSMEDKLDLISEGKIRWFNVLREYYDVFNPICEKLSNNAPKKSIGDAYSANDKNLGTHEGQMIYLTKSKYGYCVKTMDNSTEPPSWKFGAIGDLKPEDVTLEKAIEFLQYPKTIGKIGTSNVTLCKGKFGFYFKIGAKLAGIKDKEFNPNISNDELLELARDLNDETKASQRLVSESNCYMIGKTKVFVKEGEFGPYIMIPHGNTGVRKPTFINIPKSVDVKKITATKIKEIMDNHTKYMNKKK